MKKFFLNILKLLTSIVVFAITAIILFSISPIYNFEEPRPFSGPDIFNPYARLDTAIGWKRANFHTHTQVKGLFNECRFWPDQVDEAYRKFGYDIVTFSNHNKLTVHPYDPSLQVNVYEHGYNLFKYHKLVFGCTKVNHFDHFLPLVASQKQWQLFYLGRDADFIQMNHPYRTNNTTERSFRWLTGYRIMELDSGCGTGQEYWDWALDAGHYSFGLANDDLHYPDCSDRIAVRCNMLNCEGATYQDIKETLLSGAYYSMRVPDYGNGDWDVKYRKNRELPYICDIGLNGDTIFMALSAKAYEIRATGQGHSLLKSLNDTCAFSYVMCPEDTYLRLTAYFDDGAVIYSNPFARYDKSLAESPYVESAHTVNIGLTVLFNLLVLSLAAGGTKLLCLIWRKRKPEYRRLLS